MGNKIKLHHRLRRALEKRGWSVGFAASRTIDVGRQTLTNLVSGKTEPGKCQVSTALQIVNLLYPDVTLADFVEQEHMGDLVVTKHERNER